MAWQLDPSHSEIQFSAKHLMISTVRGRFHKFTATVDGDEQNPTAAKVDVQIEAASIDTRDEKRDGHLRSADFLDVERFPYITFESGSVRKDRDGYVVSGDLTIRGTTLPADVSVVVNGVVDGMKGKVAGFSGTATIDRTKWGLVWNMPIPGGVLVSEKLKLEFDLQAAESVSAQGTAAA